MRELAEALLREAVSNTLGLIGGVFAMAGILLATNGMPVLGISLIITNAAIFAAALKIGG